MVVVMGMTFENAADVPDFGSICLIESKDRYKSFRLLDDDVSKLNSITHEQWKAVPDGSDALTETGRLFIKLSGTWHEVTEND